MVSAGPRRASWSKVGGAGGGGGGGWGLNVQQYYQVGQSRYLIVLVIMAVIKYQVLIGSSGLQEVSSFSVMILSPAELKRLTIQTYKFSMMDDSTTYRVYQQKNMVLKVLAKKSL